MQMQAGIRERLSAFINEAKPGAIAISGRWGRGKTHFWGQIITERARAQSQRVRRYSYVSLFGVNSLDDLKAAIFQASQEYDFASLPWYVKYLNLRGLTHLAKKIGHLLAGAAQIKYLGPVSNIYNALSFFSVRQRLICLDDIERRGPSLRLLDVMGLVNLLWQHRECKVVVILNDKTLEPEDAGTWRANSEKVFEQELVFEPSSEECVAIGFGNFEHPPTWHQSCRAALVELGVTNIRIIERTKRVAALALQDVQSGLHPDTVSQVARTIALLMYSRHGAGENAPPLPRVLSRGRADGMVRLANKEPDSRTAQEKHWDELLDAYRVWIQDDLDHALVGLVTRGYRSSDDNLSQIIRDHDSQHDARSKRGEFDAVWTRFHRSYMDERAEIVSAFARTFPAAARSIPLGDLDSTVSLLLALNESELAHEFIEQWFSVPGRASSLQKDERYHRLGNPIENAAISDRLAAVAKAAPLPSVLDSLKMIGVNSSWDPKHIRSLASASPEEIFQVLLMDGDHWLTAALKTLLNWRESCAEYPYSEARGNIVRALKLVEGQSAFSALRLQWHFGADWADNDQSAA